MESECLAIFIGHIFVEDSSAQCPFYIAESSVKDELHVFKTEQRRLLASIAATPLVCAHDLNLV